MLKLKLKKKLTLDKAILYVRIKLSLKAVNVSVDIYLLPEKTGHRVEAGPKFRYILNFPQELHF